MGYLRLVQAQLVELLRGSRCSTLHPEPEETRSPIATVSVERYRNMVGWNSLSIVLLVVIMSLHGFAHAWLKMQQFGRKLDVSKILEAPQFPPIFPFRPSDFSREDESNDSAFYQDSRLVYHIDNGAIKALTRYYNDNLKPGNDVLDIC